MCGDRRTKEGGEEESGLRLRDGEGEARLRRGRETQGRGEGGRSARDDQRSVRNGGAYTRDRFSHEDSGYAETLGGFGWEVRKVNEGTGT